MAAHANHFRPERANSGATGIVMIRYEVEV
jgi:hypothetical protein